MPRSTVGKTVQYASDNLSVNHGNIWKGKSDNTLKSNLSQVIAGSPKELGESMNHDVRTMKAGIWVQPAAIIEQAGPQMRYKFYAKKGKSREQIMLVSILASVI